VTLRPNRQSTHTHIHKHTTSVSADAGGSQTRLFQATAARAQRHTMYSWPQFFWIMNVHIRVYMCKCTMLCVCLCVCATGFSLQRVTGIFKAFFLFIEYELYESICILNSHKIAWILFLLTLHMPNMTGNYTWEHFPPSFSFLTTYLRASSPAEPSFVTIQIFPSILLFVMPD